MKANYRIIAYEAIGFLAIILISWLDELLRIPDILFAQPTLTGSWQEGVVETIIVAAVGFGVILLNLDLIKRLHHLEQYFRVCAWCKKIDYHGEWVSFEVFLKRVSADQSRVTHGICSGCAEELVARNSAVHNAAAKQV